jgi:hypothetical protein
MARRPRKYRGRALVDPANTLVHVLHQAEFVLDDADLETGMEGGMSFPG